MTSMLYKLNFFSLGSIQIIIIIMICNNGKEEASKWVKWVLYKAVIENNVHCAIKWVWEKLFADNK
jgi:hypothetical protein